MNVKEESRLLSKIYWGILIPGILAVILCAIPVNAMDMGLQRKLAEIEAPTDVFEALEFEIGVYPTIVDNGMRFPILREPGHGFSFISVGLWFQNLPGGKGGPWAVCLAAADKYKDVMIKRRFLDGHLVLGLGYQYYYINQRVVASVALRVGSVSLGWRPDGGRITIGLEVR